MVSVSVGGRWRTSVDVTADTTWEQLKQLINQKTGLQSHAQRLTPSGEDESVACGLRDGDEVLCEWDNLGFGRHPLHYAGEFFSNPLHDTETARRHCHHHRRAVTHCSTYCILCEVVI